MCVCDRSYVSVTRRSDVCDRSVTGSGVCDRSVGRSDVWQMSWQVRCDVHLAGQTLLAFCRYTGSVGGSDSGL